MRVLRAFQADAIFAAGDARSSLRRQHGADDVQHHPRRDAARSGWPDVLLLGLQLQGTKVYSPHRWPCCSGTMPQVAADYRINTYFRDARGVYVNLYIPSTVRGRRTEHRLRLTQKGEYPYDSHVQFEVKTATGDGVCGESADSGVGGGSVGCGEWQAGGGDCRVRLRVCSGSGRTGIGLILNFR